MMNIGFFSYLFALTAFLALSLLLLLNWHRHTLGRYLVAASCASLAWAILLTLVAFGVDSPAWLLSTVEFLRVFGWCAFLLMVTYAPGSSSSRNLSMQSTPWFIGGLLACVAVIAIPLLALRWELPRSLTGSTVPLVWLGLSVAGLFLVEQLFRNTSPDTRRRIKPICLALGGLFAYDFFMYTEAMLFRQLNTTLWEARGFVNGLLVPLIAISAARNPSWAVDIHVSRTVVAQSFTIMGAGLYLLCIATAGYFIRFYGASWGGVLEVAFLAMGGVAFVALLISTRVRAATRLLLVRHFFSFKYDYRDVWLSFTRTMSESDQPVSTRIVEGICQLIDSPGGALWARGRNRDFALHAQEAIDFDTPVLRHEIDALLDQLTQSPELVELDELRKRDSQQEAALIPKAILDNTDAWLLVPLPFRDDIIGFVVIARSPMVKSINWEDRDLLRTSGFQAAGLLAQYLGDLALMDARRFEALNKLSAYVAHDLKNILNQQSLIVSNAERHKSNPQFIDDVVSTIDNSVQRMTRLMEQLRSGVREQQASRVDLTTVLQEVVKHKSIRVPVPQLGDFSERVFLEADRDRLIEVFGHLVQNAQESTGPEGSVVVELQIDAGRVVVQVIDDGPGMTAQFMEEDLFKAFHSTKGLTGMGIGAFESREFIRALGGDIRASSVPHNRTVFSVYLPKMLDAPLTDALLTR